MIIPLTPIRCLYRAIDVFGKRIGVVCGESEFTYRQFGERCFKLASALTCEGIEAGDRVAYLSYNNHQLLEGYYGVVIAKAIVMPLNVRLSVVELTQILIHSGAKMLIFENEFAGLVETLRANCPAIKSFVAIQGESPQADMTYEQLLEKGRPDRIDFMTIDELSIAELFYTSGSTGTPKGVALSHRTLYMHALSVATLFKSPEDMVDLHTIPLFHANGWGRPQASTLMGTKQVMVRRFEPTGVLKLIQHHRATDMSVVPTMANALLNSPDIGRYDLSSLRNIGIGGAAASPELVQRMEAAFGCEVCAGYGLTETSPVLTTGRHKGGFEFATDADRVRHQAMAGWSVPGVEVRVADSEMNDVPRDGVSIGEVIARGDNVMDGYYREAEATANAMAGGWFHTGDMAVWDEQSYIHIVDRKKEIIISGGENISSLEVERAIFAHPEVYECAVVAAPDDTWGEVPAAVVVRKPGSQLDQAQLLEFLKLRLGKFKLPRIIHFTDDALPKTGTGKIRKLVLREQFWVGKEKRVQG